MKSSVEGDSFDQSFRFMRTRENKDKNDKNKDKDAPIRCSWPRTELMIRYHDEEWGVPAHNDRTLFEFLILEGAQAGLSWETILNKRENYRAAFDNLVPLLVGQRLPEPHPFRICWSLFSSRPLPCCAVLVFAIRVDSSLPTVQPCSCFIELRFESFIHLFAAR